MKKYLKPFLFLLLLSFTFHACDNFDDVPLDTDYEYFVSKKELYSYSQTQISTIIGLASLQYPEMSNLVSSIASGVKVYKLTYKTSFEGNERKASGLVCVPDKAGTYPIMSFQNGTNTLHSAAPSEDKDNEVFKLLGMMGSTGFVIAIPDYLGFGEADDMFHPYLDKESTVQSIVDMLQAVKEMLSEDEEIVLNNDLYITGYSQGGWATMQSQKEIEASYSDKFSLKASACGGGPFDLTQLTAYILAGNEYPMPYFLAYLINSYDNLGMETPVDSILKTVYANKLPTLFDGKHSGEQINTALTTKISDLLQPGFIANWSTGVTYASFRQMLVKNSVAGYKTQIPTLLLHGTGDNYVPPVMSQNLYQQFQAAGVSSGLVQMVPLDGLDHSGAIIPAELAAILWFIQIKDGNI